MIARLLQDISWKGSALAKNSTVFQDKSTLLLSSLLCSAALTALFTAVFSTVFTALFCCVHCSVLCCVSREVRSSSSSSLPCARSSDSWKSAAAARVQRKPHFQGKLAHSGQFDADRDDWVLTRGLVSLRESGSRADVLFRRNFCADKLRRCYCHRS